MPSRLRPPAAALGARAPVVAPGTGRWAAAEQADTITVDAPATGPDISNTRYGVFSADVDRAAGPCAELVLRA